MRNKCIQGLRGYGALLILLSHFGILNQGDVGNAIFFCISGFLAKSVLNCKKPFSFSNVKTLGIYYLGKFLRIWPAYAVVTIISHLYLDSDWKAIFSNLFFLDQKLWFVSAILLTYLLWPFIDLLIEFTTSIIPDIKSQKYMKLVLSMSICIVSYVYFAPYVLFDVGTITEGFKLFQFMVGVCFKKIHDILSETHKNNIWKIIASFVGVIIIAFPIFTSNKILVFLSASLSDYHIGSELPFATTILIGILLLCITFYPETLVGKFLKLKFFTWYGSISFCLYMVHMYALHAINLSQTWKELLFTLAFSSCFSYFVHVLVEKPSSLYAKTFKLSSVKEYYKHLELLSDD